MTKQTISKTAAYPTRLTIAVSEAAAKMLVDEAKADGTNVQIVGRAAIDAGMPIVLEANRKRREVLQRARDGMEL